MWIPKWIRELIVQVVLEELTVGGHCGCCGKWIAEHIVEVAWPWSVCDDCISEAVVSASHCPARGDIGTE